MWRGIKVITDYNGRSSHISNDPCFPFFFYCFFVRFDDQHDNGAYSEVKKDWQEIVLKHHQVRYTLRRTDINKASGPDRMSGRTLKTCADQRESHSLQLAVVPTCLKSTTITPVPKRNAVECFNDFRPITLTPVITKCFERLILSHIKANIPKDLDIYQFAKYQIYR